ncbi:glycosyltransferase family 2 protein [Bacillus sp. FJAT-27251]|uniref:glycosyltransferase family 2 protein n=1 Tax=Bacillus sp. FJAT-27251 TaxID=1684142 RepID=UPI0006A7B7F9|nr:glycosyltransferase family 2 protein [Bacillus sp. FJAT-27251]
MSANKNNKLVSIITPTYNSSKYIKETILSVKKQIYQNWEMIIVDDASTDHTVEIIEREISLDPRVKLIRLNHNSGPAEARNTAIECSQGRYLAFLDSDDIWLPQKLERQLEFMQENQAGFSFTDYRIMNEDGEVSNTVFRVPKRMDYNALLKNTMIGTLTVVLDKKMVGEVRMPLYRDCSEDYGLWLYILSSGFIAYGLNEELAIYRKCEDSLSSNKIKSAKKTWNTYRKVQKINIPYALWCFTNYSVNALKKHSRTM